MATNVSRRSALRRMAGGAALLSAVSFSTPRMSAADEAPAKLKGNINHSVSRWCYGDIKFDDFCEEAKKMGIMAIDLLSENEWAAVKKHDMVCSMCNGPDNIGYGFNRVDHHDKLIKGFEEMIPKVAEFGFPNIICFSGNRGGMDDQQGLENCIKGLKRLMPVAEKYKVNVVMELLNSKVDHKDYMADHTAWGAEVAKGVGSERFKLLYDIYHMQIMEGDIIRTIKQFAPYIGHYHTGGNPGRNEIDSTQEIYYPAVMKAIVATGFKGYVGQEFMPKRDPLTSLRESIQICDV